MPLCQLCGYRPGSCMCLKPLARHQPHIRARMLERCAWCNRHLAVAYREKWWWSRKSDCHPESFCSTHCYSEFVEGVRSWRKSLKIESALVTILASRTLRKRALQLLKSASLIKWHGRILSAERQIEKLSKRLQSTSMVCFLREDNIYPKEIDSPPRGASDSILTRIMEPTERER